MKSCHWISVKSKFILFTCYNSKTSEPSIYILENLYANSEWSWLSFSRPKDEIVWFLLIVMYAVIYLSTSHDGEHHRYQYASVPLKHTGSKWHILRKFLIKLGGCKRWYVNLVYLLTYLITQHWTLKRSSHLWIQIRNLVIEKQFTISFYNPVKLKNII